MVDDTFNPKLAAAELNSEEQDGPGRRLTLHDQCAAFAALHNRIKTSIVAKTFGVSRIAASQISACLSGPRYHRVAQEYTRMGEEAFERKYYTPELQLRLTQAKYALDEEHARFRRGAPTRKADKKSFRVIGAFEPLPGELYGVFWVDHKTRPEIAGWYFDSCTLAGQPTEIARGQWDWKGRETMTQGNDRIPFRTSGQAFNGAYAYCQVEPPR